ncbi:MAG: thrombospondin type 3 repeat-containing protein [Deltaproteobacteria bacterium]|nr:thrombospondin type 3 repeat-containing protein [Deltaproteobacteria bacterium]
MADVPAGYYELLASCEGYRSAGLPNLELRPDQELVLPTVVLPPGDSGTPAQPADADPNGRLDDDGDGHPDSEDNCPVVPNPAQRDEDSDGVGDACEREPPPSDLDWDYVPNERDNCPEVFNPDQANADDDPLGDACDPDDDNDGILDAADRCPLIADPNNRPELCTWPSPLVYSGQDQETGDIHLYSVVMKPEGGERQRLTHAPGQAWGAEVALDVSNTWLYFHHRASDTDHFEICRIDLELAREQEIVDLQDYCHDWGGDAMNPAVCGDDLLYDWFDTDHWVVRAVPIDGLSLGGQDLTPEVLPDHQRTYSVRYASCGEELRVGFYSLGLSVDHDLSAGTDLKWTFMTDAFESPNAISGPIVYDPDASSHQLRSCPGSYGSWYLESERGARADILFIPIQSGYEEKVVDGAHNREPDYLIIDLEMDTGLLAYQSDLYGSVDVFVRDPNSSTAVRVTKSDGWEGSPSWVPLPL